MAISSDGKFLASGDRSKLILIWEAQSCQHLYTFTGHRDAVSVRALANDRLSSMGHLLSFFYLVLGPWSTIRGLPLWAVSGV